MAYTAQRSRVDPRKERESCGNARFREREVMFVTIQRENIRPSNKNKKRLLQRL
jgi:hypothetical protein